MTTNSGLVWATWSSGVRLWGQSRTAVLSAVLRIFLLVLIAASAGLATTVGASSETRSLKLYYIHTKEKAEIVFKRNGKYDQAGLNKLNRFLRDWRRNEPTKMDPRLFDLVWEVYNRVGGRDYINVISAYRSPATNDMLRRTRGGQAKKSQHMVGRAMDFYIPGVKLTTLRNAAMKVQGGGVGYYPKSGSPFVHLDVASVRAWPRMSRQELSKLFPDGKTLHLPPDGKPLPGYKVALADYKRRGGAIVSTSGGNSSSDKKRSGGLLAALFGGGDEDEEPEAIAAAPVPKAAPQQTEVAALPGVSAENAPPAELAFALPARGPMPVARPTVEQPVVMAALAPPEPILPAQAEIEAFAAAANADVATLPPAKIDLASIRAPIPELLAERALAPKPAPETPVVEVAALPVPNLPVPDLIETRMLSSAPQPVQETETAAVTPEPAELSPAPAAKIASLPSGDDFVPLPIRRPGDRAGDRVPAIEVASLEQVPVPVQRGARLEATSISATASRKGDRPTASAVADQQPRAVRTEPKLTDTMISNWALSQERVNKMTTLPGKGRRFVVNQLRAAPTVVYANAFAPGGDLPHNEFTGSAVNFIAVARFGK
ncbi:hypothetical protein IMCC20628_00382 [Hoeflea sp. IMCC20628]|uniref:DUF882 domain-containing protein n=1 Tax=Hoeflea sp. IMCC20628 TaxID=1620421 RepID=UPI00063BD3E1|nr:DUF882 domain-containing protein [Hoeflea sp. IMCC20628]AKH99109.1 hypothetical protein IMCC20628_00382 [Hoeflea sp. IMCC20628]